MVPVDINAANNNNNFTNFNGEFNVGVGEFSIGNSSENQEQGLGNSHRRDRKKRYHRHTQTQIHEMETFFNECPHPDDKQRKKLSTQLGLHPLQIKFWFQNKRTQMKTHQDRHENCQLRAQNELLKTENQCYRDAIQNALCPRCSGKTAVAEMSLGEHQLRIQNNQLKEEIDRLSAMASRYAGKMIMSHPQMSHLVQPPPSESGMRTIGRDVYGNGSFLGSLVGPDDADKPLIIELAIRAMEELMTMSQVVEPLWMGGVNGSSLVLNLEEYSRTFQMGLGPRLNEFRTEASRDTAIVPMNSMHIVEGLMNENQWSTIFCGMITRAMTHENLRVGSGPGNFDGALQIMSAELQVPSPLVTTREIYFVRYCKQQAEGVWAVVDVSIDHLLPNIQLKCRKRPSGCLIQEIPSGYSKVTWVEHVEVNDAGAVYHMYKHLIFSGQAFGANRWLATLDRECERVASMVAIGFPTIEEPGSIMIPDQGKIEILKLAGEMRRGFLGLATTLLGSTYTGSVGDDIKVMKMKNVNEPGKPPGIVLCAATSFWVPASPKTMFDFFRDDNNRNEWDVLSNGRNMKKLTQIGNGRDVRNSVNLLRNINTNQEDMMTIQETSTDPTASYVIYAHLDVPAMEKVINGADDSDIATVLPSGFVILPDGLTQTIGNGGGSLITISFQMLVDATSSSQLTISSVATVENLVRATVVKIKNMFPNPPCFSHPPFGN
ncbi:Homeobox-leucine zipper protein HDG3 [Cardamine amara subsp. amara]|uniref:Homeobox-leucine zipper protein HDG3 n=1 Tax=Cardamine amara subsp. amara TaxID=228776 RepID=A0ABD1BTA0_CARAN